jgi:hypothetical protein
MPTNIFYWENETVLKPATGYTLTAADVAKITLGDFLSNSSTPNRQSISDTHKIENSGANIGKLVTK